MNNLIVNLRKEHVTMTIGEESLNDDIEVRFSKTTEGGVVFTQNFTFNIYEIALLNNDFAKLLKISFEAFIHDYKMLQRLGGL